MVSRRLSAPYIQARKCERQGSQRERFEPEQKVDPEYAAFRDRRRYFLEQHEARYVDRGPRTRAQIDQNERGQAQCEDELCWIQDSHVQAISQILGNSCAMISSICDALNSGE